MKKTKINTITKIGTISALVASLMNFAYAGSGHGHHDHHGHSHEHKQSDAGVKAPNGGRIVHLQDQVFEFLLLEDRKVKVTFLNKAGETIAPSGQVLKLMGGHRMSPVSLSFEEKGSALISDKSFPEGNHLPVILQFKSTPEAKLSIEKFVLNTSHCSGCGLSEYACTCDHSHH